jgi:hypothetical protein
MDENEVIKNFNLANNNYLIRLTRPLQPEMNVANLLGFHLFEFETDKPLWNQAKISTHNSGYRDISEKIGTVPPPSDDLFYRIQDRVVHAAKFSGMAEGALISDGYNRDYVVLSEVKDLPLMITGVLKSEIKQEEWNLTKSEPFLKYFDSVLLKFSIFNHDVPLSVIFVNDWMQGIRSMDFNVQDGTMADELLQRIFRNVLHDRYGMRVVSNIGDYVVQMAMPTDISQQSNLKQSYSNMKELIRKLRNITDEDNRRMDELFGLQPETSFSERTNAGLRPSMSLQQNPQFKMPAGFWRGW